MLAIESEGWGIERRELPRNMVPRDEEIFLRDQFRAVPEPKIEASSWVTVQGARLAGSGKGSPIWQTVRKTRKNVWSIAEGVQVTDSKSSNYFHWVTEVLVKILLAQSERPNTIFLLPQGLLKKNYVRESLDLLGIDFVPVGPSEEVLVKKLLTPRLNIAPGNYRSSDLISLRHRIRLACNVSATKIEGHRYWVSRGRTLKRRSWGERALQDLLGEYGVVHVQAEDLTFREQVRLFSQATFLSGVHGAGLTNMLFMAQGQKVLEVRTPTDARNNCFFSLSSVSKLEYYYATGTVFMPFRNSPVALKEARLSKALAQSLERVSSEE